MFELSVDSRFAAAHRLCGYEGDCARVHGHSWKVTATFTAESQDDLGMCEDFKTLTGILDGIVDEFDHRDLNDLPVFSGTNPTAENLARLIFTLLAERVAGHTVVVRSVTVAESERCRVTYSGVGG